MKHNETTSRDSDSRVGWTADWYCGIVRMYSNSEVHADTHLNANAEALAYSDADATSYPVPDTSGDARTDRGACADRP